MSIRETSSPKRWLVTLCNSEKAVDGKENYVKYLVKFIELENIGDESTKQYKEKQISSTFIIILSGDDKKTISESD